ncbi:MAG: alpha/beta hydrolase family protein [Thermodesulfobacteriota bacterium]
MGWSCWHEASRLRVGTWVGVVISFANIAWMLLDLGASAGDVPPHFNVGFQVLELGHKKGRKGDTLTVAVWYPTEAKPEDHNYGGPTSGKVALNARPDSGRGPYPLLVFSHGYGGSGLGYVFLTEALASRGWIVACPDHHDAHSIVRIRTGQRRDLDRAAFLREVMEIGTSGPADRGKYLYRLDEMQLVMGQMLASETFGPLIDKDRVAVGGHSFGGFTALGLCGPIPERHDPRVKAVLLFSTGAGSYLFKEEELAAVRIPSMLFMGENEEGQLRGSKSMWELHSRIFRNVSPPKHFLVVKGGNHFSFNNRFSDSLWARLMSGSESQFEAIRRYSIAFLERYVLGRKDAECLLEEKDPLFTSYWREPL